MIFDYYLYKLNDDNFTYTYLVKIDNDIMELDIDLSKFTNYIFIQNYQKTNERYYKIHKFYNFNYKKNLKNNKILDKKIYLNLGDVRKLNIEKYIKNRSNTKQIVYDGVLYKICNQIDLDKYYYLNNIKNDNSKLFKYIYDQIILFYKNQYKKKL